jgi:hypothetical protein
LIVLLTPGFLVLSGSVEELLRYFGIALPEIDKSLMNTFESCPWFLTFLAIGLGPGMVEEIWCRGFLGRGLTARFGLILGVTLTSIMFGLLHGSLTYAIPTAIMGVYLHFVYLTSRSLWISILLHTLNNTIGVWLLLSGYGEHVNALGQRDAEVIYLTSFALVIFGSIALWTSRPRLVPAQVDEFDQSTEWKGEYPGLTAPPKDDRPQWKSGRVSLIALFFTLISFASLMFILLR